MKPSSNPVLLQSHAGRSGKRHWLKITGLPGWKRAQLGVPAFGAAHCFPMNSNKTKQNTHMITIAIPTTAGRLHGHFGGCREFTLVQADSDQRKILHTRTVIPPPHAPGLFPRWLREQGASVIIAGGIGKRALELFAQQGIAVRAGLADAPVEQLAVAYLNGELTATPEGCTHHGHHHEGDEHHHHHHHEPGTTDDHMGASCAGS